MMVNNINLAFCENETSGFEILTHAEPLYVKLAFQDHVYVPLCKT